jgi:hypothetical protein
LKGELVERAQLTQLKTAGASGPAETNHAILAQKIRRCVETKELSAGIQKLGLQMIVRRKFHPHGSAATQ